MLYPFCRRCLQTHQQRTTAKGRPLEMFLEQRPCLLRRVLLAATSGSRWPREIWWKKGNQILYELCSVFFFKEYLQRVVAFVRVVPLNISQWNWICVRQNKKHDRCHLQHVVLLITCLFVVHFGIHSKCKSTAWIEYLISTAYRSGNIQMIAYTAW